MADPHKTHKLDQQVENLARRGVALPKNSARAKMEAASMHKMARTPGDLRQTVGNALGIEGNDQTLKQIEENNKLIRAVGNQRSLSKRTGAASGMGGDVYAAIPRFYDPLEYWDLSGLPWNMADEGHRHKLHKWLRLYYATHYLVPILIDIFTRFPLIGMTLESKDKKLKSFYEDLFLDQLDYPEFMVQMGREFWTVGECFPLGSFDESMGVWEHEELLNPEDIVIENFPLLGSKQLKIAPPDYLKKLAKEKSPAKEYKMLQMNFPEIIPYLRNNDHIPISGVLLKQVANTLTSWDDHGTPILLRGLRTLIHEEKLMASQDAIAERLYSPLILAKLGLMDLGDGQGPWIPSPDELDALRDDLDVALSSDFRLLVHHFGIEMVNVFGREQMPRLGDDFDRIERRVMQIFGVNPSLLSAGANSQPYASSALQAEFLNQILKTFQTTLKKHYKERALVVAEAQEHWDYEIKGQSRIPIMEEVQIIDEETGEKYTETRHKLVIPELDFSTLDLRDEATERQFLQALRQQGVPVPDQKLMVGIDKDIDEYVADYNEELMKKTLAQQEAKMKTYTALTNRNLPVPADLKAEVETVLQQKPDPGAAGGEAGGGPVGPGMGGGGPAGPDGGGIVMPPPPPGVTGPGGPGGAPSLGPGGLGGPVPGGGPPPAGPMPPGGPGNAPPISMERRPGMPTASVNANDDAKEKISATVEDHVKDKDKKEDDEQKVINLPRAATKLKYSIVDPENLGVPERSKPE